MMHAQLVQVVTLERPNVFNLSLAGSRSHGDDFAPHRRSQRCLDFELRRCAAALRGGASNDALKRCRRAGSSVQHHPLDPRANADPAGRRSLAIPHRPAACDGVVTQFVTPEPGG